MKWIMNEIFSNMLLMEKNIVKFLFKANEYTLLCINQRNNTPLRK